MPEKKQIVINTGPILALIAGVGSLDAIIIDQRHETYLLFFFCMSKIIARCYYG
jgi:hypothetical protein